MAESLNDGSGGEAELPHNPETQVTFPNEGKVLLWRVIRVDDWMTLRRLFDDRYHSRF